jgi:hypothetical protein
MAQRAVEERVMSKKFLPDRQERVMAYVSTHEAPKIENAILDVSVGRIRERTAIILTLEAEPGEAWVEVSVKIPGVEGDVIIGVSRPPPAFDAHIGEDIVLSLVPSPALTIRRGDSGDRTTAHRARGHSITWP